MNANPIGLLTLGRKKCEGSQPFIASRTKLALGFKVFCGGREVLEFLGVNQRVALGTLECSG